MLEETGTPAESPLPPAILRGLGDRSYDKRKTAALDVTALIKSLQEAGGEIHLKCFRNSNNETNSPIVSYSTLSIMY
jgi:hypothetical protein